MELNKLKGFWKSKTRHKEVADELSNEQTIVITESGKGSQKWRQEHSKDKPGNCIQMESNKIKHQHLLEPLDEIQAETTSEGYGLRTPYGTHLDLDFVKYCEDISTGPRLKRTYSCRKPRSRASSSGEYVGANPTHRRLTAGDSSESIDSLASDGSKFGSRQGRGRRKAEDSLFETRRRLEAFRSFRTKGYRYREENRSGSVIIDREERGVDIEEYHRKISSSNGPQGSASINNSSNSSTPPPQHLQAVRDQVADALTRIRELEAQVKEKTELESKLFAAERDKKDLQEKFQVLKFELLRTRMKTFQDNASGSFPFNASSSSFNPNTLKANNFLPFYKPSNVFHMKEEPSLPGPLYGSPPPTPKRRFCSVGVGESIIDDVQCYCKVGKITRSIALSCNLPPERKPSSNFAGWVKGDEIDAEMGVSPPPIKSFLDASTSTEYIKLRHALTQTEYLSCAASTQTDVCVHRSVGCGGGVLLEMIDKSSSTSHHHLSHASTMTCPIVTHERSTMSRDLVTLRHARVGTDVKMKDANTSTHGLTLLKQPGVVKATSCDGLILTRNRQTGPDLDMTRIYVATLTQDATPHTALGKTSKRQFANKVAMTFTPGKKHPVRVIAPTCGERNTAKKITETEKTQTTSFPSPQMAEEPKQRYDVTKSALSTTGRYSLSSKLKSGVNISITSKTKKTQEDLSACNTKEALPNLENVIIEMRPLEEGGKPDEMDKSEKISFGTEFHDACRILDDHLRKDGNVSKKKLASATQLIEETWFAVASKIDSNGTSLDEFLANLAEISNALLCKVVNLTDFNGNTVLHYAISHGNFKIIERLLSNGELNVNQANLLGYTPAMLAALCEIKPVRECEVFGMLFSKSNLNQHGKDAGQTALMLACSQGQVKAAQLLLRHGANVNARDFDGSTPLMCAAERGSLEVVKLLLKDPGCNTALADDDGFTALDIAMETGHRDIAVLLYANGQQTCGT